MDDLDLRRMFDQIAPTQEQEATMLNRLHRTEREEHTMKRGMKRGLVALVAAALMMTAAFAVAAGLDQRLMDYFGIGQEDLTLVSNGIVQVDKSHTYKNGWTVEVKQLLFDRYCGEILVDLTAPEGTVLTDQDYRMDFQALPTNWDMTGQGWGGIGGGVPAGEQRPGPRPDLHAVARPPWGDQRQPAGGQTEAHPGEAGLVGPGGGERLGVPYSGGLPGGELDGEADRSGDRPRPDLDHGAASERCRV